MWHRFGASAELSEAIVSGAIAPVHTKHEFQAEDAHCIGCSATREDALAVEEPLEIRVNGASLSVTMRRSAAPTC